MASSTKTPKSTKIFTCPCCSERIEGMNAFRKHQNGLNHKLPCTECPRKFVDSTALKQHSESHRKARETNQLPCPQRPKKFVDSAALSQHSSVHSRPAGPKKKPRYGTLATGRRPSNMTRSHEPTGTVLSVQYSLNTTAVENETSVTSLGQRQSTAPRTINPVLGIPATGQPSSTTRPHRSNETLLSIIDGINKVAVVAAISSDSLWQHQQSHPLTILDPAEQTTILQALYESRHPPARRRAQGYIMPSPPVHGTKCAPRSTIQIRHFRETPRSEFGQLPKKRQAIVIDCEMVEVKGRRNELASLSAIDFLTGEVLIDNLVCPVSTVTDWRSDVSGVTPGAMELAVARSQALYGWQEARQALWIHADSETVFVGHSLNHDLNVLGILHHGVVDSAILAGQAVFPDCPANRGLNRVWGLKKLAKAFLGYDIQTSPDGHSSLEDVFATRDVVVWCLRNTESVRMWAHNAREEWIAEKGRYKKSGRRRERKNKK